LGDYVGGFVPDDIKKRGSAALDRMKDLGGKLTAPQSPENNAKDKVYQDKVKDDAAWSAAHPSNVDHTPSGGSPAQRAGKSVDESIVSWLRGSKDVDTKGLSALQKNDVADKYIGQSWTKAGNALGKAMRGNWSGAGQDVADSMRASRRSGEAAYEIGRPVDKAIASAASTAYNKVADTLDPDGVKKSNAPAPSAGPKPSTPPVASKAIPNAPKSAPVSKPGVVSKAELDNFRKYNTGATLGQYMNTIQGKTAVKGGANDPTSAKFKADKTQGGTKWNPDDIKVSSSGTSTTAPTDTSKPSEPAKAPTTSSPQSTPDVKASVKTDQDDKSKPSGVPAVPKPTAPAPIPPKRPAGLGTDSSSGTVTECVQVGNYKYRIV